MWHKATAKIVYDPPRPRLKKKVDWWCVATTDNEICRYYREWVMKNPQAYGETRLDLKSPSWGAHISIVRGEKPTPALMHLWKKYDGQVVEYEYSHNVRRTGDTTPGFRPEDYFFVEVRCPLFIEIRKELERPTNWKLHMTVGRLWDHSA